ncbi:MAG: sigma 54-interacting transcriptional regulator [Planctomycetota bacterium]
MAELVIKQGPGKGDEFELSARQMRIGRDEENDIRLADRTVSRFHARLVEQEDRWEVSDLDSHNGTMVNGVRVRRAELNHTDEIRLGNVVMIFLEDEVTDINVLADFSGDEPEVTEAIDVEPEKSPHEPEGDSRQELLTSNRRLLALTELARDAMTKRSLPSLFDTVIDSLNDTLQPDRVVPIVRQDDGSLLPYIRRKSGFVSGLESAGISGALVKQSLKREVAALSQKPARKQVNGEDVPDENNVSSIMCVPFGVDGPQGVLYCDRVETPGQYDREDLQYLCSVAAQVGVAVDNIHDYEKVAARARTFEKEVTGQYNLVGESEEMQRIYEFIEKAAPADAGVLICGESGTGKELVARAIRYNSPRSDGPFETVNCAAMSRTLVESELFGHVEGAFTGAVNDRPGRFELAHEGTLFLDEIGALPPDCQSKLLRVLETDKVRRVGDVKDREVDVRVVAATNKDLETAKKEGAFREDLYYRLDVLRTDLPPLRERGDDIVRLARHFLDRFQEKTGKVIEGYSDEVLHLFQKYDWPGNVRELKNVVERMVIMCEGDTLEAHLLPPELRAQGPGGDGMQSVGVEPDELPPLKEVEKEHIYRVLRSTEWNKKKAAEILGVDRSTLYARLNRYEDE